MTLYLRDSDTVSLLRSRHPRVKARYDAVTPPDEVCTSAITVQEAFVGWHTYILKAKTPAKIEKWYAELNRAVRAFTGIRLLDFSQSAIARFGQIVALKLNVGKNDLRIAAIALEAGATVVARNLRDFQRVPGLVCEDWAT
jgi:tRNA(fMet)-specific endonuclease VapC